MGCNIFTRQYYPPASLLFGTDAYCILLMVNVIWFIIVFLFAEIFEVDKTNKQCSGTVYFIAAEKMSTTIKMWVWLVLSGRKIEIVSLSRICNTYLKTIAIVPNKNASVLYLVQKRNTSLFIVRILFKTRRYLKTARLKLTLRRFQASLSIFFLYVIFAYSNLLHVRIWFFLWCIIFWYLLLDHYHEWNVKEEKTDFEMQLHWCWHN